MSDRPALAYQPALDGLRACAVVAVLLFHAGVPGFDGGYLGVSVFFTLSGFLITSLLLREHAAAGSIDLAAFYGRRLRRLLPASVLCVGAVIAIAALTDAFDGVTSLRSHVFGSVFQIANWVFLAGEGSYRDLLARTGGSASPLEHFWSLAIEEQFYLVWPPVFALVLARFAGRGRRVAVVLVMTASAGLLAPLIATVWGPDAAYWATPARLGEILVGALLAVLVDGRRVSGWFAPLAVLAFAALAVCVQMFPASEGPAYEGWLPVVAVGSALLIFGLQAPGPMRWLLSIEPLVWIGKISYGLYVFHWPVFVLIHADRFDWSSWTLLAVRLAVTLAVTLVSYWLIEQPIRLRRRARPSSAFVGAFAASSMVVGAAIAWLPADLGEYWSPDDDVAAAASIEEVDGPLDALVAPTTRERSPVTSVAGGPTEPTATPTTVVDVPEPEPEPQPSATIPTITTWTLPSTVPPVTVPMSLVPPRPVRMVVTGDSTANAFGTGLLAWAADNPELGQVEVIAAPGCGFLEPGERSVDGVVAPDPCAGWLDQQLYPAVERLRPDVVVAMVTSWDIIDRRWDGDELLTPLDAEYQERLGTDYARLVDRLDGLGVPHVAFVRHPVPDVYWLPRVDEQEDPARHAVVYGIYDRLAAERPGVSVVALDRWLTSLDLDRSPTVRPDGIHPTPEAATEITEVFLGDQLLRIALELPRP